MKMMTRMTFYCGVENEDVADQSSTANDSSSVSLSGNVDRKIATIKLPIFPCDVLVNIG